MKRPRQGDRTFPVSFPAPPPRVPDVFDDGEEEAAQNLVSVVPSTEPNMGSEGCLLMGGKRDFNTSAPEWRIVKAKKKDIGWH